MPYVVSGLEFGIGLVPSVDGVLLSSSSSPHSPLLEYSRDVSALYLPILCCLCPFLHNNDHRLGCRQRVEVILTIGASANPDHVTIRLTQGVLNVPKLLGFNNDKYLSTRGCGCSTEIEQVVAQILDSGTAQKIVPWAVAITYSKVPVDDSIRP